MGAAGADAAEADEAWLGEFAAGFAALARAHEVALVGGDTTRGPLCVTVQLLGHVPRGTALTRSGGCAGDAVFVSGTPGDAAAGLAWSRGGCAAQAEARAYLRERFLLPTPRLALGERLRGHASACIDVSDGLLGDAGKLAAASGCGRGARLRRRAAIRAAARGALGEERARELAFTGGDDYELCFAVHLSDVAGLLTELPPQRWGYTRIGVLRAGAGVPWCGRVL